MLSLRSAVAGLIALTLPAAALADEPTLPKGFKPIFNGKDLSGWHGWAIHEKGGSPADMAKAGADERTLLLEKWNDDAKKHWTAKDGELINDGNGAYLASDASYGDYELIIDYKTVAKADSGIYLKTGPQVQIWDSTDKSKFGIGGDKGSGGLWNNSEKAPGKDPLVLADKPFGEWNSFRILQIGQRTTVTLNGKLVVDGARMENYWDRKSPLPAKGPILLQTHGGEIRWKNIAVREIDGAEANEILAKQIGTGYAEIFNGKDFDGWDGPVENYEVVDKSIVCKKGKGGAIFTKAEYADFQVALEFKLPPNGNNGLGIRYPGKGDGAYAGMTELQVLDDAYKGIDPRQAHGSAYGMAAAARGYQRPIGEWNFQVCTIKGSTITVELNGNLILDTDLAKITEYMAKSPHPGKELTKGHFAFLGHSDPVMFRNIKVKELK